MKTIEPGDPNYDWAPANAGNGRGMPPKYPWPAYFDKSLHVITQGEDFDCEASSMATLMRNTARKQGLKVTIQTTLDPQGRFVLAFAAYTPGDHPPALPIPLNRPVNQYKGPQDFAPVTPLDPAAACPTCATPLLSANDLYYNACKEHRQ